MIELADARRKSAALEMRWLNLCGFCLRPGFGFPGDDYRIEQARRVYASGLTFANQVAERNRLVDFLGPRRRRAEQESAVRHLPAPLAEPAAARLQRRPPRLNNSLLREMWRTAASLELLPIQTKTQLGDALLAKIKAGDMRETALWCLARLGARKLFYGPINQVIPATTATRWVEALVEIRKAPPTPWSPSRAAPATPRATSPPATLDWSAARSPSPCCRFSKATRKRISGKFSAKSCRPDLVMAEVAA